MGNPAIAEAIPPDPPQRVAFLELSKTFLAAILGGGAVGWIVTTAPLDLQIITVCDSSETYRNSLYALCRSDSFDLVPHGGSIPVLDPPITCYACATREHFEAMKLVKYLAIVGLWGIAPRKLPR